MTQDLGDRDGLHGLVPILATPFDSAGAVDYASLHRLVEFQLESGADGVAVAGMASETFALTMPERERILSEVVTVVDHECPVVCGISATATATAIEQVRSAVARGADQLMVLPPYMVTPTPAQLIDFYAAVASASDVPIMVQDAPGAAGVSMSPELIADLLSINNVDSVKVEAPPTARKVAAVAAALGDRQGRILGGQNAQFCLEEYRRGAVGTMPACEFTDLLAPVLQLCDAGDQEQATRQFARLLPLIMFGLQQGVAWAAHKYVLMRRRLIATDTVRSPAQDLSDVDRASLDLILRTLECEPTRA